MTDTSERYRRLSERFAETIRSVPDERWDAPSPCEDWTAREVARHVVESQGQFLGMVGRDAVTEPAFDDDPAGAFEAVRTQVLHDLEDPELAAAEYEGVFGTKTFEWAVDNFLSFDLIVHGWDLSQATGQEFKIEAADAEDILEAAAQWGDMARAPGVFGPEVEVPDDADAQTRALGFVGRRA